MKVAMIGLGKLGLPCAEMMARAHDVVGYDVSPRAAPFPVASTIAEAVDGAEIVFVAVPTPHDPAYGGEVPTSHLPTKDFDYGIAETVLRELAGVVVDGQIVVLISTVLPGTVRARLAPLLPRGARLVYNPYLIAMGTVAWDMVNPEMIIIGTHDGDLTAEAATLRAFYAAFMENDPRVEIGTWEEAEGIKIFYNTFISAKIGLVNMIQDVAEKIGHMNVDVVTGALARSTQRIMGPKYMTAGMGDGGACHPRDNIALSDLSARLDLGYDLFGAIMHAREMQAKKMAEALLRHGRRVVVVGKAYKPGVAYIEGSYSLLVGHYVAELGGEVHYVDAHTGDDSNPEGPSVYLIGYWDTWTDDVVFNPGSTVVDPWRRFEARGRDVAVVHYGNTRPM